MRSEESNGPHATAPSSRSPRGGALERAWVEVHVDRLARNVARVRRVLGPRTRLLAVVKADAYGHGAEVAAREAIRGGATWLGVATTAEGEALRSAGIDVPILVLGWVSGRASLRAAFDARLTLTVCSADHAREIASTLADLIRSGLLETSRLPIEVHAKLDTGLSRLGHPCEDAVELFHALASLEPWLAVRGTYSHLACADEPDTASLVEQKRRFDATLLELRTAGFRAGVVHLGNSAATLTGKEYHYDLVRIGLAIYGLNPVPHLADCPPLEPVLAVRSRLTQIRDLRPGTGVSYGATFVAPHAMRIGVVSIGYADGVPWCLSSRLRVLIRGTPCRSIGRITMDQLIVDLSDLPEAKRADEVTLLGTDGSRSIEVRDWARELATIPWEVPCLFKSRLPRVAVSASAGAHDLPSERSDLSAG